MHWGTTVWQVDNNTVQSQFVISTYWYIKCICTHGSVGVGIWLVDSLVVTRYSRERRRHWGTTVWQVDNRFKHNLWFRQIDISKVFVHYGSVGVGIWLVDSLVVTRSSRERQGKWGRTKFDNNLWFLWFQVETRPMSSARTRHWGTGSVTTQFNYNFNSIYMFKYICTPGWSLSQFIWMSKRTWCNSMLHLSLTTVCVMFTMQPIQDDQATEKQPDMFCHLYTLLYDDKGNNIKHVQNINEKIMFSLLHFFPRISVLPILLTFTQVFQVFFDTVQGTWQNTNKRGKKKLCSLVYRPSRLALPILLTSRQIAWRKILANVFI